LGDLSNDINLFKTKVEWFKLYSTRLGVELSPWSLQYLYNRIILLCGVNNDYGSKHCQLNCLLYAVGFLNFILLPNNPHKWHPKKMGPGLSSK
jgi:hypothetical protein